ncbi:MAG TPA: hypothetical protein VNB64_11200 [Solirubrobacteraceae bacterium]|nr:hypothetical protein [Solirubrobacteraceae bacterium]
MEAATPLRMPHVRTVGNAVAVDGVLVEDENVVRLVREREEAGGDPLAPLLDAMEIGARILDREQTGANVEAVKGEMEKAARDLNEEFAKQAEAAAETLGAHLEAVFSPDAGYLSRALERHFSDGSADAVQHRVKALVADLMTKQREDIQRQFSADDGNNPLGDFKRMTLAAMSQNTERLDTTLRALLEKQNALEREVQRLHAERELEAGVAAERERGTAKGRDYEELVYEAVDAIASAQGDVAEPVGDRREATGKTGDVVVGIDACAGAPRGRIVFEAKTGKLTRPKALAELDEARAERNADFAVLVVPGEEKVPARMAPLREVNGDKLIVTYDPEDGSRLSLEVGYALARARVLMARGGDDGLDSGALRDAIERALTAMEDVRRVKLNLTGATKNIDDARDVLDAMTARVRELLEDMNAALAAAADDDA